MSHQHPGYEDTDDYRDNFSRHARAYVAITIVAFAITIVAARNLDWMLFLAGWTVALLGVTVAWKQPKLWLLGPFAMLAGTLLVRAGTDGLGSGLGPLLLIPVLTIAIYGTRRALSLMLAVIAAAVFTVHILARPGVEVTPAWRQDLVLVILATVLAIAIQGLVSRLRQERQLSEERRHQLEQATRVARKVATSPEPARALCRLAAETTTAHGVALFRRLDGEPELVAWHGADSEQLRELIPTLVPDWFNQFGQKGDSQTGPSVYRPETPGFDLCAPAWTESSGSIVCAPVLGESEVIGLLLFAFPQEFEPDDTGTPIEMLAAEASVAIRKEALTEQLELLATTDPLTGVDNRRGWDRMITAAVDRTSRNGGSLCLVMLDLDGFKELNDSRGHQVGDELLRSCARTWRSLIRTDDHIARYGGDEFLLTLPDTDLESATEIIERLRHAVSVEVACSAGIAVWDGNEPVDELLKRADRALYLAKDHECGQVVAPKT